MERIFSICIVSYQPILLEGLLHSFARAPESSLAGIGTSCEDAQQLAREKHPDILLLDCVGMDHCLSCIPRKCMSSPDTRLVVLTSNRNVDHAVRALDSGVWGYLTTRATGNEIVTAVRGVVKGEKLVCSTLAVNVMNRIKEVAESRAAEIRNRLSSREERIVGLLRKGQTNRQIAERLGISERTVKHYLSGLMHRYQAHNRIELVLALPRSRTAAR